MTDPSSSTAILEHLRTLLVDAGVTFKEVEHGPTRTSQQSAEARGEPMSVGGKSLLMKAGADRFILCVIPADRKLDPMLLRKAFGKRIRFATLEELDKLTGLKPGSVPPFGHPVLPFDLHVDRLLTENNRVAFNAGSLTTSFIVPMEDYLNIAGPELLDLSKSS